MVTKFKNDNEYELYCMLINTILWRLNELVAGPTRHVTSNSQTAMTRQVFILVLMTRHFHHCWQYIIHFFFHFKIRLLSNKITSFIIMKHLPDSPV